MPVISGNNAIIPQQPSVRVKAEVSTKEATQNNEASIDSTPSDTFSSGIKSALKTVDKSLGNPSSLVFPNKKTPIYTPNATIGVRG